MDELSPVPILDAELLRAFVAFAVELNFTRAAKRVALSQPALFERVQKLADRVGVPLYERDGRGLVLTPAGIKVAAFARDQLGAARSFVDDMNGLGHETLTLAAGEGAWLYLLGPAVRAFTAQNNLQKGDARLRALTLGGPAALDAVASGAATCAVGVFDLVPRGIIAQDVVTTPLVAALPRRHRLSKRRTLRLKDLASETLILAPPGQRHRDLIGRAIASAGGAGAPPIEADGWPLMLAFVAAGLGVAVVNGICTPPPGVVFRPVTELGSVTYRLLHRRESAGGPACARLIELVCGRR
ncbi:MAG: LysR family transcriptional regulator [Deltaproteobacteria bacterium]|nr:LysR family transcriptional regulator [Deltaproteobacteria bacterium]